MTEDRQLEETLDRLSGSVDRSGVWASIEARNAGWQPEAAVCAPGGGAACASRSSPPSPSFWWQP